MDKLKEWVAGFLKKPRHGGWTELEAVVDSRPPKVELHLPLPVKRRPSKEGCGSCSRLSQLLSECGVCLETLQTRGGVYACEACGNVTCGACAPRLSSCPFCRRPSTPRRCVALERLLTECPPPPPQRVASDAITIDVANFRAKVVRSDRRKRKYEVELLCHDAAFLCRIELFRRNLRMAFLRSDRGPTTHTFGVGLDVRSSCKTLTGLLPLARHAKVVDVSCDGLLSPLFWKRRKEERVQIQIDIRLLPHK